MQPIASILAAPQMILSKNQKAKIKILKKSERKRKRSQYEACPKSS